MATQQKNVSTNLSTDDVLNFVFPKGSTFVVKRTVAFDAKARKAKRTHDLEIVVDISGMSTKNVIIQHALDDIVVDAQRGLRSTAKSESSFDELIEKFPLNRDETARVYNVHARTASKAPEAPKSVEDHLTELKKESVDKRLAIIEKMKAELLADGIEVPD